MGRILVMNHVTLDGVMQGPARPGEDTRRGFTHSGWTLRFPGTAEHAQQAMGERIAAGGGLRAWLFGRWTYEDLLGTWNERGGPFKDALNAASKYVVSDTLADPPRWPNSTILRGDPAETVGALKAATDGVVGIMGSGQLIATLMEAGLIDEYLLFIYPLVLGAGRRLFPDDVDVDLRLVKGRITSAGSVIASYEPAKDGRETSRRE